MPESYQELMLADRDPPATVILHGDVVYFEFCLHEMDDPAKALIHAKSLAPDIVV